MPTYSEAGTMSVLAYHTTKVNGVPTLETGFTAPAGWSLFDVIDHTSTDGDHAAIFKTMLGRSIFMLAEGLRPSVNFLPILQLSRGKSLKPG